MTATIAAVIGMPDDELPQREAPFGLQKLAFDLQTIAEEDHDQHNGRQI